MFKKYTFIFLLIFFHELGHALAGKLFNWKLLSITIYPYGGLTLFSKLENSSIKEEFIILILGPIFQIITYYILTLFFKYDYIKNYHLSILIFNLLPILPLDGGKLLNLILNYFFNYLNSFYLSVIVSFITVMILVYICIFYYNKLNLFLMCVFLIFKIIRDLKNIKYCYHKFLLERYLYKFSYKKIKTCRDIFSFYKECNHYIGFIDEGKYLENYFKKNR